jgi:hypothetical protein
MHAGIDGACTFALLQCRLQGHFVGCLKVCDVWTNLAPCRTSYGHLGDVTAFGNTGSLLDDLLLRIHASSEAQHHGSALQ